MTANVEIITRSVEDVIVLRNGAIKNMNGKNVVTIDEDGVRREVEVET
ncbi:MAG: hypothetical protein LBF15_03135 [Candidatus Peribacteria bacterium]|jgi:hypothetical protein|nr:hypothetical protein [Candidatus Peribacteria bacterium]